MFLEFSVKGQNLCEQKFPVSISAFSANVAGLDYTKRTLSDSLICCQLLFL